MANQNRQGRRAERSRTARGTSLIEVLVVIVVFLVGILAVAQIFPGGFKLLVGARERTLAQQLDASLLQKMAAKSDGLPEQIVGVDFQNNGGTIMLVPFPNRKSEELGLLGDSMNSVGAVYKGTDAIGYWPYVSGPNVMRRIVGEGHRIPSPRSVGSYYGSLLTLDYGPVFPATVPITPTITYGPLFEVYGQDLVEEQGAPGPGTSPDYEFFLDQANTPSAESLYLPRTAAAAGAAQRTYRILMTVWVRDSGGNLRRLDTTGLTVVDSNPSGGYPPSPGLDLQSYLRGLGLIGASDTLDSVVPESVRVARQFELKAGPGSFSIDGTTGKPNNPYEYAFVSGMKDMGQILFSPAGYNYTEARPEGRVPLIARVSYDVFDWRIIHEDFRIPDNGQPQYKLMLSSLRILGHRMPDGTDNLGLGLNFLGTASGLWSGSFTSVNRDFVLLDLESGATYFPDSYSVDMSTGVVTFINQGASGLQMHAIYPGATSVSSGGATINAAGRMVRALYMANGDWSIQPMKASAQYLQSYGSPGLGQYYVGNSAAFGGAATRIYFPWADLNQKIKVGEVLYVRSGDTVPRSMKDQDFIVKSGVPADALNLPYIDITDVDGAATALDSDGAGTNSYGYGVKDVRGISVVARAIWNSSAFNLTNDSAANLGALNTFQSNYHRNELETVIQRSDKP